MIEIYELQKGLRVMIEQRRNRIYARQTQGISYGSEIVLAEHVKDYLGGCVYENSLFFLFINEQGEAMLRSIYDTIVYCQVSLLKEQGMTDFAGIGGLHVAYGKLVLYFIEKKNDEKYEVRLYYPFEHELDQRIGDDSDLGDVLEFQRRLEQKDQEIKRLKSMIESAKSQYNQLMDVATKYRDEAVKWRGKFE